MSSEGAFCIRLASEDSELLNPKSQCEFTIESFRLQNVRCVKYFEHVCQFMKLILFEIHLVVCRAEPVEKKSKIDDSQKVGGVSKFISHPSLILNLTLDLCLLDRPTRSCTRTFAALARGVFVLP
jgi:hypothetical protein